MNLDTEALKDKAKRIRFQTIKMLSLAGTGHPGGSLSEVEILVALYYRQMKINPSQPKWEERDRFVLSKGHANPPLYAILADLGYFEEQHLWTLRKLGSILQGHPDMNKTPGIDYSTGSLGQGFSAAVGMAMAAKAKNAQYHIYTLTGDGELQEGLTWEAAMAAAHYKLDNLTVIVDSNRLQIDGKVEDVMSLGDLQAKFEAFGFAVKRVDGHSFPQIIEALNYKEKNKPLCILADTIKGKGISYMEDNFTWHGMVPSGELLQNALKELEG